MYAEDEPITAELMNKQENITSYAENHYKIFDLFAQFREVLDNSLEENP